MQLATDIRNAQAELFESMIGTSPVLRIYTGSPPASISDADTGTLLCSINLPSDWMTAASNGATEKSGTWSAANVATGVAGHFRIRNSSGTTRAQGTVSQRESSGGAGDLKLSGATADLIEGHTTTVSAFSYTQGGA